MGMMAIVISAEQERKDVVSKPDSDIFCFIYKITNFSLFQEPSLSEFF